MFPRPHRPGELKLFNRVGLLFRLVNIIKVIRKVSTITEKSESGVTV